MTSSPMSYEWYLGTPEGDRLSVLALGHRMTFREKVLWSEQAFKLAKNNSDRSKGALKAAIQSWPDLNSKT